MRGQPAALRTLGRRLDVNTAASWRHGTTRFVVCRAVGLLFLSLPFLLFDPFFLLLGLWLFLLPFLVLILGFFFVFRF